MITKYKLIFIYFYVDFYLQFWYYLIDEKIVEFC